MNSRTQQEIPDFIPNSVLFGPGYINNDFFSENKQNKSNTKKEFELNIFLNNNNNKEKKENEEINKINKNNFNLKNKKNINTPSYFFQDYDDDFSENNDNERLIINTINDLENLDDSNHFENLNFDNTQEV